MVEATLLGLALFLWLVNQRLTILESLVDEHWRDRRSIKIYEQKEDE